jgi:hypothetical protein
VTDASEVLGEFDPQKKAAGAVLRQAALPARTLKSAYAAR